MTWTRRRRSSLVVLAVLVMASVLGLAACGGDGRAADRPADGAKTTTTRADAAAAYVGLSKQAAIAKADADGRPWRIGREDDQQFMLTQDFVENRVTFEIDDGKVTKATLG